MNKPIDKGLHLCRPNPQYLIKSIAEQGYSLETAFADLIDNSISAEANNIEILTDTTSGFMVFITDNGIGMTKEQLIESLSIPSSDLDNEREVKDLGRFGLGLKTASFSQTRNLTVLSKKEGDKKYNGFLWDVEYLKKTEDWTLKVLTDDEINILLTTYYASSDMHLNTFENYLPNTLVIWQGLFKYENYLQEQNKIKALNSDLSDNVEEYLSISFHRFITRGLKIRLNNKILNEFDPFPEVESIIKLPKRVGNINSSSIKFEGFVIPYEAIKESKEHFNRWTTPKKSLMDMEGLYIYRGDRLISYGGWHGIIKRSGKMQLGRMKIDIGNDLDNVLKLNVAKSQIEIPFELKSEFNRSLEDLKENAQKEFYNVGLKEIKNTHREDKDKELFRKVYTNKGALIYLNYSNPLLNFLFESFDDDQRKMFKVLTKNINAVFNKNRQFDSDTIINEDNDSVNLDEIETAIAKLRELGIDEDSIRKTYISNIVSKKDINHIL